MYVHICLGVEIVIPTNDSLKGRLAWLKREAERSQKVRVHNESSSSGEHQEKFVNSSAVAIVRPTLLATIVEPIQLSDKLARDIAITDLFNQTKATSSVRPFDMATMTSLLKQNTRCLTGRKNQSNLIHDASSISSTVMMEACCVANNPLSAVHGDDGGNKKNNNDQNSDTVMVVTFDLVASKISPIHNKDDNCIDYNDNGNVVVEECNMANNYDRCNASDDTAKIAISSATIHEISLDYNKDCYCSDFDGTFNDDGDTVIVGESNTDVTQVDNNDDCCIDSDNIVLISDTSLRNCTVDNPDIQISDDIPDFSLQFDNSDIREFDVQILQQEKELLIGKCSEEQKSHQITDKKSSEIESFIPKVNLFPQKGRTVSSGSSKVRNDKCHQEEVKFGKKMNSKDRRREYFKQGKAQSLSKKDKAIIRELNDHGIKFLNEKYN